MFAVFEGRVIEGAELAVDAPFDGLRPNLGLLLCD